MNNHPTEHRRSDLLAELARMAERQAEILDELAVLLYEQDRPLTTREQAREGLADFERPRTAEEEAAALFLETI